MRNIKAKIKNYDVPKKLSRPRGKLSSLQLREIIEYIHTNLVEEVTITNLAEHLNLSAFHFARLFKNSLGLSPHQYVLQNRIERAKKLIAVDTGCNLTDIALQVGFYDQTHFGKAFKRTVGVSPKVFTKHQAQSIHHYIAHKDNSVQQDSNHLRNKTA